MKLSSPGGLVLVAEISDLISDADLGVFLQIYLFYVLTQSILIVYSMLCLFSKLVKGSLSKGLATVS